MKKILSCTKTTIVLLLVTVLFLGFYTYMLARPISYGMSYHNAIVYEGVAFAGSIKFDSDGTLLIKNTNFDEEMKNYYYYKDDYVFTLMAETDEDYEAEVRYIDENFEEAVASPFYAAKINAFRQVAEGLDSYVTTYTCTGAIIFAAVGGVVAVALLALTVFSVVFFRKTKSEECS